MIEKVSAMAKNAWRLLSKNSPTILTGVAVTGVITTVILAVRATPKAMYILDEECQNHSCCDPMTKRDIVKYTWKCYIPAAATGAVTIACIIGANHISLKRNAMLVSLYSLTESAFKEYQSKVIETIGANKEAKVRDEISADHVRSNPVGSNEVVFIGKGQTLCYDSLSGRYFKTDIEHIRRSVNELNRELLSDMFITLNQFYDAIGLADTVLGNELGWDIDKGLIDISFSAQLTETGEPCLVINYTTSPKIMSGG